MKNSDRTFKIRKVKKLNCSDVIIYDKNSELVKEYNQKKSYEKIKPRIETKEISEQEKLNNFYKRNISILNFRLQNENISKQKYNVLVYKLRTLLKKKKIRKTSIQTLSKKFKNFSETNFENLHNVIKSNYKRQLERMKDE